MVTAETFTVPREVFPSLLAATEQGDRRRLSILFLDCYEIEHGPSCSAVGAEILTDWLACEENVNIGGNLRLSKVIGGGVIDMGLVIGREVLASFDQRDSKRLLIALSRINNSEWHERIRRSYAKESECSRVDVAEACNVLVELAQSKSLEDGALIIILTCNVPVP